MKFLLFSLRRLKNQSDDSPKGKISRKKENKRKKCENRRNVKIEKKGKKMGDAMNVFVGARVCRGVDWKWGRQVSF